MNLFSKNILKTALLLSSTVIATSTLHAESQFNYNIAHFADEHDPHNRLITVDFNNMRLLKTSHVAGSLNHHADSLGTSPAESKYIMMVAKGSNFVTIRRAKDASYVKKINLPFRPRSGDAYNKIHDLVLLNSRDRPAGVLIDATKLKIVGRAGFNTTCNKPNIMAPYYGLYKKYDISNLKCSTNDFGGDQISGHPIWISAKAFVLLDRSNRLLHVYSIHKRWDGNWDTKLEQTIKTDTSLHQIIPQDKSFNNTIFYGETEGNSAQGKSVVIYKWKLRPDRKGLIQTNYLRLDQLRKIKKKLGFGGHNLFITPDKRYLYAPVGSRLNAGRYRPKKGGVIILKSSDLTFVRFVKTGFGAGHVNFSKQRNIAVVTNHKDNYVTAIDTRSHTKIKDIRVKFKHENIFSLNQSHSPYIDEGGKFYYNFWTDGGVFFRINLDRLKLDKAVYVGGIPIQGNYYPTVRR